MIKKDTHRVQKSFGLVLHPKSLARQLTLWLALLVCLLESVVMGGVYFYTSHQLRMEFEQKIEEQLNAIKENLTRLLWEMDYEEIGKLGEFYDQVDFIDGITIWREEETLFSNVVNQEASGSNPLRLIVLYHEDVYVGKAAVYFSRARYQQQLVDMRNSFLITFVISLFTILIFTGVLFRKILQNTIKEVTRWIGRIGAGDYSSPYSGDVHVEMVDIVTQFRGMALALEEKEKHLVQTNKELTQKVEEQSKTETLLKEAQLNLEQKIEERTVELHKANLELLKLSKVDGLTQIANRRHFDEYLNLEWKKASREGEPLSLLLCDIDFFKLYNDNFGHKIGDDCLVRVARIINESLERPSDLVARFGGEEFSIIMPNTDKDGAVFVANKIQANLKGEKIDAPDSVAFDFLTLSIGVSSCIPGSDVTIEDFFLTADKALYKAKESGRNCIAV